MSDDDTQSSVPEVAGVAKGVDAQVDDDLSDKEVPFRYSITSYGADYR